MSNILRMTKHIITSQQKKLKKIGENESEGLIYNNSHPFSLATKK
jgi:hypothetical protein